LLIAGRTREMLDTAYDAAVLAGIIGLAAPLGWIAETLALYLAEIGDIQASARFAGYARSIHPATTVRVGGRLVVQRRLEEALATALSTSQRLRLATEGAGWSGTYAAEQAKLICGP
jgi:hypothetical protein